MTQQQDSLTTGSGRSGRRAAHRSSGRGTREWVVGWSLAGVLVMGAPAMGARCVAQTAPPPWRLSVRPREMATATQNQYSGWQEVGLDPVSAKIYVPPKCLGPRRCPMLMFMGGIEFTDLADQYGIILFPFGTIEPNYGRGRKTGHVTIDPGLDIPYLVREMPSALPLTTLIDTLLTLVLHQFAIDPDKIAVTGNSYASDYASFWGTGNPDVFSRVIPISAYAGINNGVGLPGKAAQQFYGTAEIDSEWYVWAMIEGGRRLRQDGYAMKMVLEYRGHVPVDYYMFETLLQWLQESWAMPDAAPQPAPRTIAADSLPLLTTEALTKMAAFWRGFEQEPQTIYDARMAIRKEVLVPLGGELVTLRMTDMPALAAKAPSVAAALKEAGLTPEEHDAYRIALTLARLTVAGERARGTSKLFCCIERVEATSVLGKNAAFYDAHPKELQAFRTGGAGIWNDH